MKNTNNRYATMIIGALLFFALVAIICISYSVGTTESTFYNSEQTSGNSYGAWTSVQWTQTTQGDFDAGVLVQSNTSASPGNVYLDRQIIPASLYAMSGDDSQLFWKYTISSNTWTALSNTPDKVKEGGALTYAGGNYLYAFPGRDLTTFWRYNISGNSWTALSNTPDMVKDGGALTYTGGNYIYALAGRDSQLFWRYNISSNTWTALSNTPDMVKEGGALSYTGGNYLYALAGKSSPAFWRYNISGNSWTAMSSTPVIVKEGGALTYGGSNYLYAFPGGGLTSFLRYNITANSWTTLGSSTPASQKEGAALAYDGGTYIYAFQGNVLNSFWRYTLASDTWSDAAVSDLPPGTKVGWGGSLVYVPPYPGPYYSSGTLASQVKDTGETGARWDALEWDRSLPGGTGITFEVRASGTSFLKDNTTLSWTSVGGTSPVYTLSGGRYFQWRATLTTSDTSQTPVLNEVRAYYT